MIKRVNDDSSNPEKDYLEPFRRYFGIAGLDAQMPVQYWQLGKGEFTGITPDIFEEVERDNMRVFFRLTQLGRILIGRRLEDNSFHL